MKSMNLKQFADLGGCKVVLCGPGWGGRYGYTTSDCPEVTECGYKTKTEARKQWLQNTFGEVLGNAVMQLLESSNVKGEGTVSGPAVSGSLTADITGPP